MAIVGERFVVAVREFRPGGEIARDDCVIGDGDTESVCECGSRARSKRQLSGSSHLPVDVEVRHVTLPDDRSVSGHRDEIDALNRRSPYRASKSACISPLSSTLQPAPPQRGRRARRFRKSTGGGRSPWGSRDGSWRPLASTTPAESTRARMARITCSGSELQAAQKRASRGSTTARSCRSVPGLRC
jgi:hypothetical protein